MPNMADIAVLKADGSTSVTYTAITPAGADQPAVWRNKAVGSAMSHNPELRLHSRDGNGGKSRVMRGTYVYPSIATNTTTGVTSVVQKAGGAVDLTMPKDMTAADIAEFSAQFANLLDAALIQSSIKDGFAPT